MPFLATVDNLLLRGAEGGGGGGDGAWRKHRHRGGEKKRPANAWRAHDAVLFSVASYEYTTRAWTIFKNNP